jgi:precorrin-4/cobalt-precorrin-4 C11-methyltransferase
MAQVYFIGVGPGDPELLTVKGQRLIRQADVVIYADSLIPPAILELAQPTAEILPSSNLTLEEILATTTDRVRQGKSVARLHSGDLSLYSAVNEQLQGLRAVGITTELVPGISVFQAAAAYLQVELTVPEVVQTIILTRIQGRASAMPPAESLASLATHRSSLCLYLAAQHLEAAQAQLLLHYPPDTPVAICYRVSWPDQQILLVPLDRLVAANTQAGIHRTAMYLVSPALADLPAVRSQLYHPDRQQARNVPVETSPIQAENSTGGSALSHG